MEGLRHKKYWKYYLAILFAVALVLLPAHQVQAGWLDWGFEMVFANAIFVMFTLVGKVIGVLATLLNWVIHFRVYPPGGIEVVNESWKIMRDFANMFFIVALIIMAFATIFNVTKYEARTLFPKFLISALLINFSLVLGVLVIDASQILSNTFLTSIGDMSMRLGQELNPSKLLPSEGSISGVTGGTSVDAAVFGTLVSLLFSVVLLFTFLFSLLTAFLFAIIRIPILWALLVVSPIAWILNVFPAGQGIYKKWWSLFIGWNMFLPIFLFFLYFGLYFLSGQDDVIKKIAAVDPSAKPTSDIPFSVQLLFFYVLAAIFLIGGTITAMKASMFSGTGVVSVAKWSRGIAAKRLGITGAGQAAKERLAEIQAGEGKLGRVFGGPLAGLETSRRLLGVRGADYKSQKEFVDRAGKEYNLIQNQYDTGKISVNDIVARAGQGSATNPESYAYRKMAAKMGKLDDSTYQNTIKDLTHNPYAMQDFIKTAAEAKFSDVKGENVLNFAAGKDQFSGLGAGALPGRREAYKHVQSNALLMAGKDFDENTFVTGLNLFGGNTTAEGKKFIEDVAKTRPDLVVKYNLSDEKVMAKINERRAKDVSDEFPSGKPPITESNRWEMFDGYLKDEKDIANLPISVWRDEEGFQEALRHKLTYGSNKEQANYRNRLIRNLRTAFGSDDKKKILDKLPGYRGLPGTEGTGGTPPQGGQVGFGPSAPTPPQPPPGTNPSNVVDLRNPK